MKKILIFSLAYYPRVGGAEVAIKEITDRIADVEFHMVTMRFSVLDPREETLGRVQVHRVGSGDSYLSKILFVPRAALLARRLHRQERFDGAWAMMSYMLYPLVLSRIGLPYALTLQEGDTYGHMFGRLRILPFLPLLRRGFRRARVVSAISNYLAAWAKKMGYSGEVQLIPNGADVQKFSGTPVLHEGTVLFTSSRLVHKNAIDDIIRALPLLPQSVRLVVAGTGPDEPALKALAHACEVESRIEWKGHIEHAALPALLHAADIFVRPSRSEGFGISFVEAFAAGVPVIATQEGGIADFLFDAKRNPERPATGWAVEKDNPRQIAEAVQTILGNPAAAAAVVDNARKLAVEQYDWSGIAHTMREKVFARLFS